MKRLSILASFTILGINLYSKDINLTQGWSLKAALEDINSSQLFTKNCIETVWSYNSTNNRWEAYSPHTDIKEIILNSNGIDDLISLKQGEGYWINVTSDDCTLDVKEEGIEKDEVIQENVEQDEVVPEDVEKDEVVPKDVEQDEVIQEDAEKDEVVPKDVEQDEVVPENVEQDEVVPENVEQDEVVSENVEQDEVVPEDVEQDEVVPKDLEQDEVIQEDAEKDEVIQEDAEKDEVVPENLEQDEVVQENVEQDEVVQENVEQDEVVQENVEQDEVVQENVEQDEVVTEDAEKDEPLKNPIFKTNNAIFDSNACYSINYNMKNDTPLNPDNPDNINGIILTSYLTPSFTTKYSEVDIYYKSNIQTLSNKTTNFLKSGVFKLTYDTSWLSAKDNTVYIKYYESSSDTLPVCEKVSLDSENGYNLISKRVYR